MVGLLTTVFGAWLIDSAVQNRPPIKTLENIVRKPGSLTTVLSQAKGTAYPVVHGSSPSGSAGGSTGSAVGQAAVAFARSQIGKPYKWGATGPNAYDCSGLVQASYKAAGISIPRTTQQMLLIGTPVSKTDLQIGDLVFPDPTHVQLYSGGGNIIESPHSGLNVREVAMWGFMTARRVISAGNPNSTAPGLNPGGGGKGA